MSTEFLDAGDLETLTGYKLPSKQIEWLHCKRIPFRVNARGRPVVHRNLAGKPREKPELGPVP